MVQHLALPLRVDGRGRLATVEQGTVEELAQNVAVILATPVGSRVEVPEFGAPRPDFLGPDPAGMAAAVDEWEPRATLTVEDVTGLDPDMPLSRIRAVVAARL